MFGFCTFSLYNKHPKVSQEFYIYNLIDKEKKDPGMCRSETLCFLKGYKKAITVCHCDYSEQGVAGVLLWGVCR